MCYQWWTCADPSLFTRPHCLHADGALCCTFCGCWQVCSEACPPSQGHTELVHCPAGPCAPLFAWAWCVVVDIPWVLTGVTRCVLCLTACWAVSPCTAPVRHPAPLSCPWSAVLFYFVTYHFLLQNIGSIVYIFNTSHFTFSAAAAKSLSHVRLLATPWTTAHQAPPSMGFSRQEYWSGLPLPSPPPSMGII